MFRRRRFVASHRRPGLWRLVVRPVLIAAVAAGAPLGAAVWLSTSPRFELSTIHIATGERVPAAWAARNLQSLRGRHTLLLSLDEVEGLLADHRWVEGVEVSKRLPDALLVEILERVPVAVVRDRGVESYVDRAGEVIDVVAPDGAPELLRIDAREPVAEAVATAVRTIDELRGVARRLHQRIERVELLAGSDLELRLVDRPYALLVRPGRLQPTVSRFERLQPEIERRFGDFDAVDLRFHRQIVLQFPEA